MGIDINSLLDNVLDKDKSIEGYKKCTKCKEYKPVTSEYFSVRNSAKDGFSFICKECDRTLHKQHYQKNREKIIKKVKEHGENNKEKLVEYRLKNKDKIKQNNKRWNDANRDHIKEYDKNYNSEHREEQKQYARQYRIDNPDKSKEYYLENADKIKQDNTQYRKDNPEVIKVLGAKRRAIKFNQSPNFTEEENFQIKLIYKACLQFNNKSDHKWHVDHVIPLSKGGLHHPNNLQVIPAVENLQKNNSLTYEVPRHLCLRIEDIINQINLKYELN